MNYLRIILENGKIASEIPEVPAERYDELHCATTDQLKLYERPAAASAAPSPGNSSLWAADIAGALRVDRQWAYNGTTCALLGSGKISVLFWLDHLLSALRGEYSIHDGKQQGLFLRPSTLSLSLVCGSSPLPGPGRAWPGRSDQRSFALRMVCVRWSP